MTEVPAVSVILPAYNAQQYLVAAVESILQQTFTNFELILINDGSTDDTDALIKTHFLQDPRVRYYSQANRGLIATLNTGLQLARGRYIARMDADDIADPMRLEKQFNYLQQHSDVAVLGSAYRIINAKGEVTRSRTPPRRHAWIQPFFWFGSPFAHPSVMMNRELLRDNLYYDPAYQHAEDFELWIRLSGRFKLANLPDKLLDYRVLASSVSRRHTAAQKAAMNKAIAKHFCHNQIENQHLMDQIAKINRTVDASVFKRVMAFASCLRQSSASFSKTIAWLYLAFTLFSK